MTEYIMYLRQFKVIGTTQSYMTIHYQVSFFTFGKCIKELGKDTHQDYHLKSTRTKRKLHKSSRSRFLLKTETKLQGTGLCKKARFLLHRKQVVHPLGTATSQSMDVYCEVGIELKHTNSMKQSIS
jgi:hypothetical protein